MYEIRAHINFIFTPKRCLGKFVLHPGAVLRAIGISVSFIKNKGDEMKKNWLVFLGLLITVPFALGQAKDFPNRAIKIIVPFTAGSGSDTSARFFGEQLSAMFGQPVVVDNRPGARGVIAVMAVKQAAADGHTILLASNSPLAVNPITVKNLPYDPLKDLKPISGVTRGMNAFVVAPDSKIQTLADLVGAAKKSTLNVGTYSAGYQLAMEWFARQAGVKFMNIPYKGGAQVFTDVIGRQLDFGIVDTGGAVGLLKTGKLRALAVSGETRHQEFPDVPTIGESGYPEYVNYSWTSFYVRADTPADTTDKLASAMQKALSLDSAKEFVKKTGGELMPYAPDKMREYHRAEYERFRGIADASGIKPE
jgi:tripartite-type tricarboxylate transporter receptor subunit TctC